MIDKKCLFLLADGARADIFEHLLSKGDLPNVSKYIVERGTYINAVTVFPSTTGPAYIPYLLGKYPGHCNMPGIRWFDRYEFSKNMFSLKGFRSYIGPEAYLMNKDISANGTPTIFEQIPRSVSILNEITKGLSLKGDKTKLSKIFYKIKSHFTNNCDEVDEAAGRMLLKCLDEDPQFIFCVFLGIDTYSHQNHPFHKNVVKSYYLLDRYVGLVGSRLSRENRLEDTLIIIASDHGLTSTHSHFDSSGFMDRLGYKTLHHTNVFNHLLDANASVMVSGNSMAHIYVKNQDGWTRNTFVEEMDGLMQKLLDRSEIDIIAGRSCNGDLIVQNTVGKASISVEGNSLTYRIISGNDPFGYGELPSTMSFDESLKLTMNTNYPDALVQVVQLFESSRTGDFVISAKPGIDLRAWDENPEHNASHGSLVQEHMLVPLSLSINSSKKYVRTTDVYPTILDFFELATPSEIDGSSLIN